MKKLLLGLCLFVSVSILGLDISVMTYNIRLDHKGDNENNWQFRKKDLAGQISLHSPMVFGVQEALQNQMEDLHSLLPNYKSIGVARDDGKQKGEYSALFYNDDAVELLNEGTFWLSENPASPSTGWDAALPRICTWGIFRLRNTKQNVMILNTHFDHVGEQARINSIELIWEKAKQLNPSHLPVIVMGDLNLEPNATAIKWLQTKLIDSYVAAGDKAFGPIGTFNGFNTSQAVTRRIDYIFYSINNFSLTNYAVLSDFIDGRYLSDHFPVLVQLQFKQ